MKYSFVLPAYKAQFLKKSIDSILCQTYDEFELIIVNDASPEDLDSIVKSYNDERIQYYVNDENLGGKDLVDQWNHSISYAKGEYLILASDDDLYDSNYLHKMDQLICKYPNVDVFRPRIQFINHIGEVVKIEGYLKEYCSGLEFLYAWSREWIESGIPFYIFKRQTILDIGGFAKYPLAWFADDATVLRLAQRGIVSSQDVLFSFRWSGVNITTRKNTSKDIQAKVIATKTFYEEACCYIANYSPTSQIEEYIKSSVACVLSYFLVKSKLISQLCNTRWRDVTRILPFVLKMRFVERRQILNWYKIFTYRLLRGLDV